VRALAPAGLDSDCRFVGLLVATSRGRAHSIVKRRRVELGGG
jgi:hypothetical protein